MKIAIFDSGLGGLSVWRELKKIMPGQHYLYFADSKNCPYGDKPLSFIIERAEQITRFFIEQEADIIVVACNTATAAAISYLRSHHSLPFVGIEPAVKPAVRVSKTGVVGVLATANTLKAELYHRTLEKFASDIKVISQVGEGLVDAVENAQLSGSEIENKIKTFIDPMLAQGADTIVLGCTHFPFLEHLIRDLYGDRLVLLDPAPAVALQTQRVLNPQTEPQYPITDFYTNGPEASLAKMRHFVKMIHLDGIYRYHIVRI